jgi:hypothetical protein
LQGMSDYVSGTNWGSRLRGPTLLRGAGGFFRRFRFRLRDKCRLASPARDPLLCLSPPAHLRLTPPPALVARAQGGLTLRPAGGELGAEKYCHGGLRNEISASCSPFPSPIFAALNLLVPQSHLPTYPSSLPTHPSLPLLPCPVLLV